MNVGQAERDTLDLSGRLRLIMTAHRLSVSDLAKAAGVSKSAMEKYLAGPSSPRAVSIVSLCLELGLDAEWLLFGKPDEELFNIRRSVVYVVGKLLSDMKQDGELRKRFEGLEAGSKAFDQWAFVVADQCGVEVASFFAADRKKALSDAAEGVRTVQLPPIQF